MILERGILISVTVSANELPLYLPAIETIVSVYNKGPVHLLVSEEAYPLVENYPGLSSIMRYPRTQHKEEKTLLIQQIKNLGIKTALILSDNPKILPIIKKAGVNERLGFLRHFRDILTYTKWMIQDRSKNDRHEVEYNLALLGLLGIKENQWITKIKIPSLKGTITLASDVLSRIGINSLHNNYIIIQADAAKTGSPKWKPESYSKLADSVVRSTGNQVIVICAEGNDTLASRTQNSGNGIYYVTEQLLYKELASLISRCSLFIGTNTWGMYLADALETPVISIFPPLKQLSPKRFGPRSFGLVSLVPKVECTAKLNCLGTKCSHYNCMDKLTVSDVLSSVMRADLSKIQQNELNL